MADVYDQLSTIDPGDGRGAGACNDGIYLVRRAHDALVCVEKHLPPYAFTDANGRRLTCPREIAVLRTLRHPNILRFVGAVVDPNAAPPIARLYTEYYSHGSLADMLRRLRATGAGVPEAFVWHVFFSLVRALVYLRTGSTHPHEIRPARGWAPLLHRDIKPLNVFLRNAAAARADRHHGEYPLVVLGDFGLAKPAAAVAAAACRSSSADTPHGVERLRAAALLQGTPQWQPPELPLHDARGRGDLWAVGAVVHALCHGGVGPVDTARRPRGVSSLAWAELPAARQPRRAGGAYSTQLNSALSVALTPDLARRPDACGMFMALQQFYAASRGPVFVPLPEGALPGPARYDTASPPSPSLRNVYHHERKHLRNGQGHLKGQKQANKRHEHLDDRHKHDRYRGAQRKREDEHQITDDRPNHQKRGDGRKHRHDDRRKLNKHYVGQEHYVIGGLKLKVHDIDQRHRNLNNKQQHKPCDGTEHRYHHNGQKIDNYRLLELQPSKPHRNHRPRGAQNHYAPDHGKRHERLPERRGDGGEPHDKHCRQWDPFADNSFFNLGGCDLSWDRSMDEDLFGDFSGESFGFMFSF